MRFVFFLSGPLIFLAGVLSGNFYFWDLFEDNRHWHLLFSTLGSLEEVKKYIELQTGPFEEIQESEDAKRATPVEVQEALQQSVAATLSVIDQLSASTAELQKKDPHVFKEKIEKALQAAKIEVAVVEKVLLPKTLREALIVRLNDMFITNSTLEEFEESKERMKTTLQQLLRIAEKNIGKEQRSIPRYKDTEDIRKMIVNKADSIRILPKAYKKVVSDKISSLRGLVMERPK